MGHEKKKRKKDKDHDGERKRRRRLSEERDAGEDESRSHRRKHKRHKERSRKRRHDSASPDNVGDSRGPTQDDGEFVQPENTAPSLSPGVIKHEDAKGRVNDASTCVNSTGNDSSLSIEETNRLRASLGLKPLDIGESAAKAASDADESESKPKLGSSDTYAIHKRPDNIGEKKRTETVREKLKSRRQQREIETKLSSVGRLGAADMGEEESASAWVQKSRKIVHEKELAAKRAAMLDDLDTEFGIGSLVEEDAKIASSAAYSSADIVGMTVAHSTGRIKEGREVVLTLEDRDVLDEEHGDVLVNVNMVDDEHHEKNVNIRKTKLGYQPDDDNAWDEEGNYRPKTLLSQYDEELNGPQRSSFVIGHSHESDTQNVRANRSTTNISTANTMEDVEKKLRERVTQSLQMAAPRIALDFYTEEEMTSFKRVKKKVRKVRKKVKTLKADDLLPLADEASQHLGRRTTQETNDNPEVKMELVGQDSDEDPMPAITDDTVPTEDLTGVKLEPDDGADIRVNQAIERTKRLKQVGNMRQKNGGVNKQESFVNMVIKSEPAEESGDEQATDSSNNIVLNTTAEFCRSLGDIPTYGLAGNRDESTANFAELEREASSQNQLSEQESAGGAWSEIVDDSTTEATAESQQETSVILDEEPEVGSGLAGALKLAMKKGYVDKEPGRKGVSQQVLSHLRAQNYSIDDKSGADEDRGRRGRGGDFYSGPSSEFHEKKNYKPDIHLEYIDDQGRLLCPKEAFRYLSHKFHGKGSGKIKTEKREKKFKEERLMAQMNSTDTPLNTLSRLQEKQKQLQSPFVVLSGNSLLNSDASTSQVSKR